MEKRIINSTSDSRTNMLLLKDQRRSDNRQLWVVGCSTTHGLGVATEQRYGQLIADALNLPVSFLTWPGSSIEWCADQILRSDIRKDDIIVWGLTSIGRTPYYSENHSYKTSSTDNVLHLLARAYEIDPSLNDIVPIDQLYNKNAVYRAVTKVYEVVNICNKLNIELVIGSLYIMPQDIEYFESIPNFINLSCDRIVSQIPNFVKPTGGFKNISAIDIGSDNLHPGPLTHQWYAKEILSKLTSSGKDRL